MVAHTKICSGSSTLPRANRADALKPAFLAQAVARGADPELYATQLALPSVCRLLPDSWRHLADCAVADPSRRLDP